ncbi:MAG: LysE family translocator [Deinococcales bacterium]
MIEGTTLLFFVTTVLVLFITPGPNMFFVLSYGIAHGKSSGLAAAFGIVCADLTLTLLTASGVSALVAAWEASFDLLRIIGALYLLWLAFGVLSRAQQAHIAQVAPTSRLEILRRSMLNSLLNPKALLFFMLFLPQFVQSERGNVGWQLLVLGLTLTAVSVVFHSGLGLLSGVIGQWLAKNSKFARVQSYLLGFAMTLLALRLLLLERPN